MWVYEKKLEYPVNIKKADPKAAGIVIAQLGGPDGELGAAMRYLNQRYTVPFNEGKAMLTDIGTEELAHIEIVSAIVYQLTKDLTIEQIKDSGFDKYFVDHTLGIYPCGVNGTPFSTASLQCTGDIIADLSEDMAAEQKARVTYENILRLVDDPEISKPIEYLRAREVVHYQRFGDVLRIAQDKLNAKNYYAYNPEFDRKFSKM